MDSKLHLLESFTAHSADGTVYKVLGYEQLVRDESIADGQDHWEPTGRVEYRLAEGAGRVAVGRDGSMRIESSGIELNMPHSARV